MIQPSPKNRRRGAGRAVWEEREDDLESQLNRSALWAVSYGDMMSYLLIFFMMLYVGSNSRSLTAQMANKAISERFGGKGDVIQELFSKYGVQKIATLEMTDNRIRIVFQAPVLFDPGSAKLKPSSFPELFSLVGALKELPNNLQIEGHTDDRPLGPDSPFSSNWELSSARAFSVLRFLEINGIPPQRLSAIGYGEFRPLKPNTTLTNRAINRRIEINILRREEQ